MQHNFSADRWQKELMMEKSKVGLDSKIVNRLLELLRSCLIFATHDHRCLLAKEKVCLTTTNGVFTWTFLSARKNRCSYFLRKSVSVGAKVSPKINERPVTPFHWDEIRSNLERKSQSGFKFRLLGLGPESKSKSRFDIFCCK
jgi:hypothetical protein